MSGSSEKSGAGYGYAVVRETTHLHPWLEDCTENTHPAVISCVSYHAWHGALFTERFSHDDQPGVTEVFLEEGAAGKTAVDAVLVMDGISDAYVSACSGDLYRLPFCLEADIFLKNGVSV